VNLRDARGCGVADVPLIIDDTAVVEFYAR
jgi:hypothetical protein